MYPRAGLPQICENSDSSLGLERREGSVVGRAIEDGEVVEKPHVEEKGGRHICVCHGLEVLASPAPPGVAML